MIFRILPLYCVKLFCFLHHSRFDLNLEKKKKRHPHPRGLRVLRTDIYCDLTILLCLAVLP